MNRIYSTLIEMMAAADFMEQIPKYQTCCFRWFSGSMSD